MELQTKELEIAAVKTIADDLLKHHGDDSSGYKELKKQKRLLGKFIFPSNRLENLVKTGN